MTVQPLTYAYNKQGHRSTNKSHYSVVLRCHPPGHSLLIACTNVPDSSSKAASQQTMRANIQIRSQALRLKTEAHTVKSQERNKHTVMTDEYEILVYSSKTNTSLSTVTRYDPPPTVMLKQRQRKLTTSYSLTQRNPRTIIVQWKTLTITEYGIPQINSIDSMTLAPGTTDTNGHQL